MWRWLAIPDQHCTARVRKPRHHRHCVSCVRVTRRVVGAFSATCPDRMVMWGAALGVAVARPKHTDPGALCVVSLLAPGTSFAQVPWTLRTVTSRPRPKSLTFLLCQVMCVNRLCVCYREEPRHVCAPGAHGIVGEMRTVGSPESLPVGWCE